MKNEPAFKFKRQVIELSFSKKAHAPNKMARHDMGNRNSFFVVAIKYTLAKKVIKLGFLEEK